MCRNPGIDDAKETVKPLELIELSDYTAPTMPTEQAFRAIWARLKRRMSTPEDPFLSHSVLDRASLAQINDLAGPPDGAQQLQAHGVGHGLEQRRAGLGRVPGETTVDADAAAGRGGRRRHDRGCGGGGRHGGSSG